jgi:hypothetical protein
MADLTTLAKAREWLGIPGTVTTDDALLTRLVSSASDFIQTWLNRTIASQSYTETRDGTGGRRLLFSNYPVTAVSSVQIDGQAVPLSTSVSMDGYVFNGTTLSLRGGTYRFSRDIQNVVVAYTAGFGTVPNEIEQSCLELVGLRYKEKDRIGLVSKGLAGETTNYTQKDMSDAIQSTLTNYKKVIPV